MLLNKKLIQRETDCHAQYIKILEVRIMMNTKSTFRLEEIGIGKDVQKTKGSFERIFGKR
jgi:hypothetical protein